MKEIINNSTYGEIVYEESFWVGKKSLTINGVKLQSISKKEYLINGEKVILKGSFLTGVNIIINNEKIELIAKPKVYEIILAILPILFLLTWGNSVALCSVFPVIGGAIGGAVGAIFSFGSMMLMKKAKSILSKILIGIAMFAATIAVGFVLAILFVFIFS